MNVSEENAWLTRCRRAVHCSHELPGAVAAVPLQQARVQCQKKSSRSRQRHTDSHQPAHACGVERRRVGLRRVILEISVTQQTQQGKPRVWNGAHDLQRRSDLTKDACQAADSGCHHRHRRRHLRVNTQCTNVLPQLLAPLADALADTVQQEVIVSRG